jgi:hypothetical protein
MAKTTYSFVVVGKGPFPLDMLRYDGCYPATPGAVEAITSSFDKEHRQPYKVALLSNDVPPTEGRWRSFGCSVINLEARRS